MCLTILFCAGMPILLPILIVFCVTSVVMDRMNLLTRYEPPPLTNALTLRFVISVFLPPFLMLHCVLGSIMFGLAAGEEMRHAAPHAESVNVLLHPPLQLYLAFSVVFVAFEAFHFCVVARRSNLRQGVLTPMQLCCAPCKNDEGFTLAGMAAIEKLSGLAVTLPDPETARTLYQPPHPDNSVSTSNLRLSTPPPEWLPTRRPASAGTGLRTKSRSNLSANDLDTPRCSAESQVRRNSEPRNGP